MQGLVPNPITSARQVLAQYDRLFQPRRLDPLGSAGGFSGAGSGGWNRPRDSCAFAAGLANTPRAIGWSKSTASCGMPIPPVCCLSPRLCSDSRGRSVVAAEGYLWELTPWLPGQANYQQLPSPAKLQSAMIALARFHLATAGLPGAVGRGVSAALAERRELLQDLLRGGTQRIATAIVPSMWPELTGRAKRWLDYVPDLAPNLARQAEYLSHDSRTVQPCIRDVWHDHVLFEGDQVSGIVDFGAMRQDHVAVDVARLVGSLVGDAADERRQAFAAYQTLRPLTADEWQTCGSPRRLLGPSFGPELAPLDLSRRAGIRGPRAGGRTL